MPDDLLERAAREICKSLNTGQCASICLSHSSLTTGKGKCPSAKNVWKEHAKAAIAIIQPEAFEAGRRAGLEEAARVADEFTRPVLSQTVAGRVTQMAGKSIATAIRRRINGDE